jgi:hypothetical protein
VGAGAWDAVSMVYRDLAVSMSTAWDIETNAVEELGC